MVTMMRIKEKKKCHPVFTILRVDEVGVVPSTRMLNLFASKWMKHPTVMKYRMMGMVATETILR